MTWCDLTVEQYQAVYKVMSNDGSADDKIFAVMGILLDKTEREINAMSVKEFNEKASQIAFAFASDIPGNPVKEFTVNGKAYAINYRIDKMRWAQYVEIKSFLSGGVVPNLHLLMASIVCPVKKFLWFRFPGYNDSAKHEEVANDMLKAKFVDLYHSCLFFYQVYKNSMEGIKDYLVKEMSSRMSREEAMQQVNILMIALDGFMPPVALQSITESN